MTSPSTPQESKLLLPLALAALWGQLYLAAAPIWRFGEYYSFGWFVPPLAVYVFARRWARLKAAALPPARTYRYAVLALLLLASLTLIRAVASFDPSWRLALLLQGALVAGATHLIFLWWGGWKLSLSMLPVTIYALSALPYPGQFEQLLIRKLTSGVIAISGELFNLIGRPVTIIGEKLESMGTTVEVTDGCSGIRSFQNLIMAALFFGELFLRGALPRILLLAGAVLISVAINTARAMVLALIRFDHGEPAFHAAHETVGFIALVVGVLLVLSLALLLGDARGGKRQLVRNTTVAS